MPQTALEGTLYYVVPMSLPAGPNVALQRHVKVDFMFEAIIVFLTKNEIYIEKLCDWVLFVVALEC